MHDRSAPWREGTTFLYGQDIKTLKPKELWSNVSYIPQSHGFAFSYTGLEMVMLGRCSHLGVFEQPSRREIEMAEAMMEKNRHHASCQKGLQPHERRRTSDGTDCARTDQ